MIVVTYWYLFLGLGLLFTSYAIWRQVKRVRSFMNREVTPFFKDLGNIYLTGNTPPRSPLIETSIFSGLAVQLIAALIGSVLTLIGMFGLVTTLIKS